VDPLEPNNTVEAAANGWTSPGDYGICPAADRDFFWAEWEEGKTYRIEISFDHDVGDLDLALLRGPPDYLEIAVSQGLSDRETITHQVVESGIFLIRVFGFAGATGPYTLEVDEL
jgi:hypothetical protein